MTTTFDATRFTQEVSNVMRLLGATPPQDWCHQVGVGLFDQYSERHRVYHDVHHPIHMVERYVRLEALHNILTSEGTVNEALLLWMILAHDVEYKLGRDTGWNEQASAHWSSETLQKIGFNERFIQLASLGIKATVNHHIPAGTPTLFLPTLRLFLDLDLWGLAVKEGFDQTTERVWQEFRAVATRREFAEGRQAWARKFNERPRIFHTELGHKLREEQARANLAWQMTAT